MALKPIINSTTKYTDNITRLGIRKWEKTANMERLRLASKLTADTTQFTTKVFKNSFNEIKNNLSVVFGKNLSNDEMVQLCETYKKIFAETDNLQFLGKLYTQLMKDFGLDAGKLKIALVDTHPTKIGGIEKTGEKAYFYIGQRAEVLNSTDNKIKLINVLCHELTHLKQNMIAYGTSSDAYIEALARNCQKRRLYADKDLVQVKEIMKSKIEQGILTSAPKIEICSEMGQKGIKYINGNLNYITSDNKSEYMAQLIEKEAFDAGDMAEQAIRFILAGLI